jgi:uncharacterized membrane protein YfcA
MAEAWGWLIVVAVAFAASVLAGVAGFGSAVLVLPFLIEAVGPRDAVVVLSVAQLFGNSGRVWANRREVEWRVVGWYAVGAVPAAILGGVVFAGVPLSDLTPLLGGLLLVAVTVWCFRPERFPRLPRWGFAPLGAASSFGSALVGSVGPLTAPFFVSFGLVKGAYVGTEAVCAAVTHLFKLVGYGQSGVLSGHALLLGGLLGGVMVAGSLVGKRLLDRLSPAAFVRLVQVSLLVAGVRLLLR